MRESIKITNAALDDVEGEIILRGVIDPDSLHLLKSGPYQREVLPIATINDLVKGFESGSIPDIDLGLRGGNYTEKQGAFYLSDDCYIIDGLQRATAALLMLQRGGPKKPRLGATIHFNTTEEWERKRFKILNTRQSKLSPNILIRNLRTENAAIETLYTLSQDKTFVLADRVCWQQRQARNHLITGFTMLKVAGNLHAHAGPGKGHAVGELAGGLEKIQGTIGKNVFRDNMRRFFDMIDENWGIKAVAFKEGAVYLRSQFMLSVCNILSKHTDFWRGERLTIDRDLQRKIASFPVTDPHVNSLSSAGGSSRHILYGLMLDHINSGKRTKRLTLRQGGYDYGNKAAKAAVIDNGQLSNELPDEDIDVTVDPVRVKKLANKIKLKKPKKKGRWVGDHYVEV